MIDRRLTVVLAIIASGVSAVATSFAIYATSEAFLVSSFNHLLLEVLPGAFVSSIIQQFGNLALELSLVFSGGALSVVLGLVAFFGFRLGIRLAPVYEPVAGFALAALLVLLPASLVVGSVAAVVPSALVGAGVLTLFATLPRSSTPTEFDADRRTVVTSAAAVVAFNVVAHALGLTRRDQRAERELQERATRLEAEHLVDTVEDHGLEGEGIKPLVAEVGDFFQVDINPSPPAIDADTWSLSVTGLVADEREFAYEDVLEMEPVHEYKAIRCLSDDIDGDELDMALWTGVRMGDLLAEVEPDGEYAMLTGADDYFYSIPLSDLEDSLLAFGMNGLELPAGHGYPMRVLVPDRWGKLHVKWLEEIEIIDAEEGGYWEERGWHGMGPVNAVTKIDRINRPGDRIQIVGHAYAGARGVDTVEVSIDGGDTWEDAELSEPLPDPDTIRQWRYEIDPDDEAEGFEIAARTVDGDGTVEPEERTDPFPDGATGWATRSINA